MNKQGRIRTGRILAGSDLDELLDVTDFLRLDTQCVSSLLTTMRREYACHGGFVGSVLTSSGLHLRY